MATGTLDGTQTPVSEETEQKFQYPGIPVTCDGAEAVVWVETRICQGSGAFPITSSTTMGSGFNAAVQNGIPNLWGDELVFVEPESEHSSATFCEGFAAAGGPRFAHLAGHAQRRRQWDRNCAPQVQRQPSLGASRQR